MCIRDRSGVNLTANSFVGYSKTLTTDDSGIFELDLPKGIGYVISFDKEDEADNGMTVFDIIMVSKHILSITPFEEDYQYIAADINNSGSVTTFDMVLMRKVILGIDSEFTDNSPWRFMPANGYSDENSATEPTLSETITIPVLENNLPSLDYLAIKVGDLNGSANINGLVSAEDRNSGAPLMISTKNQLVKRGENVTVSLTTNDLSTCLLYTSPSPRDATLSRMPSSA